MLEVIREGLTVALVVSASAMHAIAAPLPPSCRCLPPPTACRHTTWPLCPCLQALQTLLWVLTSDPALTAADPNRPAAAGIGQPASTPVPAFGGYDSDRMLPYDDDDTAGATPCCKPKGPRGGAEAAAGREFSLASDNWQLKGE